MLRAVTDRLSETVKCYRVEINMEGKKLNYENFRGNHANEDYALSKTSNESGIFQLITNDARCTLKGTIGYQH